MKNFIFIFIVFSLGLQAQTSQFQLNANWKFQSIDNPKGFLPAKVPGSVHADLFENEWIPHPFVGNNESDLQWISNERWQYVLEFELTQEQLNNQNADLVFEGLDTYAKVMLNGVEILNADNAFRTWKSDVKKLLKKKNKLQIEFTPTKIIEDQKKKEIPYALPEGNRIFTRKAQFQYGWDWGPKYNTMGIWRPVYLEFWNSAKIEDVYIKQLRLTKEMAELEIEMEINLKEKSVRVAEVYINGKLVIGKEIENKLGTTQTKIPITIQNPKLWWTHNLGEPYLYDIQIRLRNGANILDHQYYSKGLRTIELVTEKDELGESFYFKLNGVPVYMKGANYIPQSSFQSWVSDDDYENILQNVVDSNMNMLRVWGGGIYENDIFYEICDEKGILVWQDFMFACAMYPGDEEFLENVRQEAIDNVKRLRNHSSVALWCGNNESSEGWHRWGWQDNRSEAEKTEIWGNYQKLFNGILPEIVEDLTDVPYWETSPKFGRGDSRYISDGDAHDWWIWHDGHPFENLENKTPRFMSEFGFQSFPSLEVIEFINGGNSTSISADEFKNHQKHSRGFDIIKTYMERDFPVPTDEEDYVYVSQVLQAYGIGKGIEAQRRNKPNTMGSLYWQLNDVWPAVSWSGIDSFGNWKALQYQVRHSFLDVLVTFERVGDQLEIFVVNDDLEDLTDRNLEVKILNLDGTVLKKINQKISVKANESLKAYEIDLKEFKEVETEVFVQANFDQWKSKPFYLVKPKELKLKKEPIRIRVSDKTSDGFIIELTSKSLHKNLMLSTSLEGEFSDNYFDVLPNETYKVYFKTKAKAIKKEELELKCLNDLENQK